MNSENQRLSYEDILAILRSNLNAGALEDGAGTGGGAGAAGGARSAEARTIGAEEGAGARAGGGVMETSQSPMVATGLTPEQNSTLSRRNRADTHSTESSSTSVSLGSNLPGHSSSVERVVQQSQSLHETGASTFSDVSGPLGLAISRDQSSTAKSVEANPDSDSKMPAIDNSATACSTLPNSNMETRNELGCLIVPCRARGMPEDHNPRTAYFLVPEKIKHGTDLICSHLECQEKGVKFCYCVYCKAPFAKRNFRQRHLHADDGLYDTVETSTNSNTQQPSASASASNVVPVAQASNVVPVAQASNVVQVPHASNVARRHIPPPTSQVSERYCRPVQVAAIACNSEQPSAAQTGTLFDGVQQGGVATLNKESVDSSSGSFSEGANPKRVSSDSDSTSSQSKLMQSRREIWDSLFDKRPENRRGNDLSAWLLDVLAVTDLTEPFTERRFDGQTGQASGNYSVPEGAPGISERTLSTTESSGTESSGTESSGTESSATESSSDSERQKLNDSSSDDNPNSSSESVKAGNVNNEEPNASNGALLSSSDPGEARRCNDSASESNGTSLSASSDQGETLKCNHDSSSESHGTSSSAPSRRRNTRTNDEQSSSARESSTSTDENDSSTGSSSNATDARSSSINGSSASSKGNESSGLSTDESSSDSREGNDSDGCSNKSMDGRDGKSSDGEYLFSEMTTANIIKSTHAKRSLKRGASGGTNEHEVKKKPRPK